MGLHSRTHGLRMISNDRAVVKGIACQSSGTSEVVRRAAGDLRYKLGLCQTVLSLDQKHAPIEV